MARDRIALRAAFDPSRYDAPLAHRLLGHLESLLLAIAADPNRAVEALPLLSPGERHQLLHEWNDTATRDGEHLLHGLFEAQVRRSPEAVAAVFEGDALSYRELDARANRLAHHLRSLGVGPESRVGVFLERSLDLVVALLGILKAGGAYVPLDPSYPRERLAFMLEDGGAGIVLTQESLRTEVPGRAPRIVCVDAEAATIGRCSAEPLTGALSPANLAYVIYTSGSTGRPKGVMVPHRSIANHMVWMQREYPCTPEDRVLQKTPFSFDASIWEIFLPLMAGGRLVLPKPGGHQDFEYLAKVIDEQGVTVLQLVPSLLQVFLEEAPLDRCASLRRVFCGGEALADSLRQRVQERLAAAELCNLYGPTEAAIDASWCRCRRESRGSTVPIGRPLSNLRLLVLDAALDPAPIGVAGYLYIGGVNLARGYFGRPDLTAERFVPDPVGQGAGERLYRTGDVARLLGDGEIEFLGRQDHQVKVRGVRIELSEIEAALGRHAEVLQSVVTVREDRPGHRQIVAYVVPERGCEMEGQELRTFLQEVLPPTMLPAAFVLLESLPLAPNGKVNRAALPAPEAPQTGQEEDGDSPRTPLEDRLAAIWAEVLGRPRVGIHDDFFALGGDSILSIQIVSRAAQVGLRITPQDVFQHPTVAELVKVAREAPALAAEQGPVTGPVPATPIQRRFFAAPPAEPHHFNQSVMVEARQPLDLGTVREAVRRLLAHHDALRLRALREADGWRQEIVPPEAEPPVALVDLAALPERVRRGALEAAAAALQKSLDLAGGPVTRVALFRFGAGMPDRLLWIVHHLAVDGVSWRVLLEDLQNALRQLGRGEPVSLPAKTTSFQTWAERLASYRQSAELRRELDYWLDDARATVPPLPLDGARPTGRRSRVFVSLNEDDTRALLQEIPVAYRAQIQEVLLAALARAFEGWSGEPRLLVDLEGHGREELFADVDLSRTAGWFTTLYPVLLELERSGAPGEALRAVKEQLRAVPRRGIGYGLLRYSDDRQTSERLAAMPQAEVLFNYLGQFDQVLSDASLFGSAGESRGAESSFHPRAHRMEVNALIAGGCLQVDWAYDEGLHARSTIERLSEAFLDELEGFIAHGQGSGEGAVTLSDFPSARLTQDELGKLASLLGDRG